MRCRWCGQPIRPALGAWVHAGPGGGFYCRTELAPANIWPPPPAEPDPAAEGPAIGRHAVDEVRGTGAQRARA